MRTVILDAETDGLQPTLVHCIVCIDINTNEVFQFVQEDCYSKFKEFIKEVGTLIGHNVIAYDIPLVLKNLLGIDWKIENTEDTFVMSSLSYSDRYIKDVKTYGEFGGKLTDQQRIILRKKPHSLEAFGIRCGRYKPEIQDWSTYTPEMLNRCTEDCQINLLTYKMLREELKGFSEFSIRLEHRVADIIAEQVLNGVYIDSKVAIDMYEVCKAKADILREEITREIPPRVVKIDVDCVPRVKSTKVWTGEYKISETTGRKVKIYDTINEISTHTKHYTYITDNGKTSLVGPFSVIKLEPFNPDSPDQRLEVLEKAGWKPINFNKPTPKMIKEGIEQGNPLTTDEDNLDTIPPTAPQGIKKLGLYLMYTNRYKLVEQWMALRDSKGYVHGYVNSCGTPTGRMRHNNPNLANIVSVESQDGKPLLGEAGKFGFECRNCFSVEDKEKYELVGCDAASLEIRMLAHYMNDFEFTNEVLNGDIYVKIQKSLGLPTRRMAKAVLLAFIYGAGAAKLGRIIGGTDRQGSLLKGKLLDAFPALKTLIHTVTKQAKLRGRLDGLDGRRLWVRKEHAALNLLLQSAGAIVMKRALVTAYKEINSKGLDCKFVLNVHDEIQCEVLKEHSKDVGEILVRSIVEAGEFFNMNIKLGGQWSKGSSWSLTH